MHTRAMNTNERYNKIALVWDPEVLIKSVVWDYYFNSKCNVLSLNGVNSVGNAGFDLVFPKTTTFEAGKTTKVDLGVSAQVFRRTDPGLTRPLSYYIYPRSSISKTPLRLANSVGIIDSTYRGNLIVVVDCIGEENYTVKCGTSLFQVCMPDLDSSGWEATMRCLTDCPDYRTGTTRGTGGFGSTN